MVSMGREREGKKGKEEGGVMLKILARVLRTWDMQEY